MKQRSQLPAAHRRNRMITRANIKGHLHTINVHKVLVMRLCFRCGLYRQGILHDLSKYSPLELKTGFRYYQGNRSPIDAQKEQEGYSFSWLHHKGRNPHHWEYWLDNGPQGVHPVKMERRYVAEMFCDRVAASMVYQKDTYTDSSALEYYRAGKDRIMIHPETARDLEYLLEYLADNGLDLTLDFIRRVYRPAGLEQVLPL